MQLTKLVFSRDRYHHHHHHHQRLRDILKAHRTSGIIFA